MLLPAVADNASAETLRLLGIAHPPPLNAALTPLARRLTRAIPPSLQVRDYLQQLEEEDAKEYEEWEPTAEELEEEWKVRGHFKRRHGATTAHAAPLLTRRTLLPPLHHRSC